MGSWLEYCGGRVSRAWSWRAANHRRLRVARSVWTSLSKPAPAGPAVPASSLCCWRWLSGLSLCPEPCTAVIYTLDTHRFNQIQVIVFCFLKLQIHQGIKSVAESLFIYRYTTHPRSQTMARHRGATALIVVKIVFITSAQALSTASVSMVKVLSL